MRGKKTPTFSRYSHFLSFCCSLSRNLAEQVSFSFLIWCDGAAETHRLQVKVQDVVHVGGQGGEQRVEGPVGAHLGDDDGPQRDGKPHGHKRQRPAVTFALQENYSRQI